MNNNRCRALVAKQEIVFRSSMAEVVQEKLCWKAESEILTSPVNNERWGNVVQGGCFRNANSGEQHLPMIVKRSEVALAAASEV